jgi:hypothetical protein
LLYLIRTNPNDPQAVWTKLEGQFQRKTWANKLQLRRKLFALKLKEGESVNHHVKTMSEIFEALAVIGDAVGEEDKVVHLLASLPDSYDMLVTALEAQSEIVPKWELVTERLIHEELKVRDKSDSTRSYGDGRKALTASSQKHPKGTKSYKCHFCHKPRVSSITVPSAVAYRERPSPSVTSCGVVNCLSSTNSASSLLMWQVAPESTIQPELLLDVVAKA